MHYRSVVRYTCMVYEHLHGNIHFISSNFSKERRHNSI